MAHTKSGRTTKGNRDSFAKRLGVKLFGGQIAMPGSIIVRQKGSKFHPGTGTRMGRDFTIFAVTKGKIDFYKRKSKKYVQLV